MSSFVITTEKEFLFYKDKILQILMDNSDELGSIKFCSSLSNPVFCLRWLVDNDIPANKVSFDLPVNAVRNSTNDSLGLYDRMNQAIAFEKTHLYGNRVSEEMISHFYVIPGTGKTSPTLKIWNLNQRGLSVSLGNQFLPVLPDGINQEHWLKERMNVSLFGTGGSVVWWNLKRMAFDFKELEGLGEKKEIKKDMHNLVVHSWNWGTALREVRKELKLSLEEVATRLSLTSGAYGSYERGERVNNMSYDNKRRFSNAFGISVQELDMRIGKFVKKLEKRA